MTTPIDDPEFLAWAHTQFRAPLGPAKYAVKLYLLHRLWTLDPAISEQWRKVYIPNAMYRVSAAYAAWGDLAPYVLRNPAATWEDISHLQKTNPRALYPNRYHECTGFPNLTTYGTAVQERP